MEPGRHAEEHTGGLYRFHKEHMYIVAPDIFKPVSDPAGSPADPARDIDEERVAVIDRNTLLLKLRFQPFGGDSVAHEEVFRVLIVHKVTLRVRI